MGFTEQNQITLVQAAKAPMDNAVQRDVCELGSVFVIAMA